MQILRFTQEDGQRTLTIALPIGRPLMVFLTLI